MERWTIEKIKEGFEKFYKAHGSYPTSHEVDDFTFLPSSRQIQRRFGGLPELRKILDLKGPMDFTKGEHSSERASKINARAHKIEQKVYEYLVNQFGVESVHREYFFIDDRRTRTDFFVYYKEGNFSIDAFYPANIKNLIGCLNSKIRAYKSEIMMEYPVIFLMMNENIDEEEIERVIKNKKNKLHKNQYVFTYNQLKEFCDGKKKLPIGE